MKVFTRMESANNIERVAVALGTFDGVHLGHQKVICRAVELARQSGGKSTVFTFANHPLSILAPHNCPPIIISSPEKQRLLIELGVDILYSVPFNKALLRQTPVQFIDNLLALFSPSHIIIGPNYSFGYCGQGTPELLQEIGEEKGFQVEVQKAVYLDTHMVSSTAIRTSVAQGDIEQAARLMGRPFCLSGIVIHGDKRGRTIGTPTANIQPEPEQLLPSDGVYLVYAILGTKRLPALANVGNNPTFANQNRRVEVHILDFQSDLYGQELRVEFCRRLRGENVYPTIRELQERISIDIAEARTFFADTMILGSIK